MSLRRSLYVAPSPLQMGAQRHKTADSLLKLHFTWRNSATISFFVWILPETKLQGIYWPICPCKKMVRGGRPILRDNLAAYRLERGGSYSAKISCSRGCPPPTIFARLDRPVNFVVADSNHTKKLCSRLSSSEVHFSYTVHL